MIPESKIDVDKKLRQDVETTKTYKISGNRIQGFTDKLDALQQAIYKILNTEMFEYPIYNLSYGIDLGSLMGKDSAYVKLELKRRIQACLLNDISIKSVNNFLFNVTEDAIRCTFEVVSIYGEISMTKEVNV